VGLLISVNFDHWKKRQVVKMTTYRSRTIHFVSTILVVGSLSAILEGCSRRVTDFTIISTKNTLLAGHGEKMDRRIEGEDCKFTLLGLPDMKTAIDDAVENAGPDYDALVDGVVWYDDRFIYVCYRVEGTPIRARDNPSFSPADAPEPSDPRGTPGLQMPIRPKQGALDKATPEPDSQQSETRDEARGIAEKSNLVLTSNGNAFWFRHNLEH
jgi:hypothetical protein